MTVICPGDAWEVRAAVREAIKLSGPVYLRLGKKNEPAVHTEMPDFKIGRGIVVSPGEEICLLSTGNMLPMAMRASLKISAKGISTQVVSFHTIKPLDQETLFRSFEDFRLVVTVEEHSLLGGLGGSIAEWLASRQPMRARLLCLGKNDSFLHEAGGQQYARDCFGLTAKNIAERSLEAYAAILSEKVGN
jgi:transketolase